MKDQVLKKYAKYLFIAAFIIIAVLAFLVVKNFLTGILSSLVLAYLFHPWYKKLNSVIKKDYISAFIITILLIIIIIIPTFFVVNSLVKESLLLYNNFRSGEINLPGYVLDAVDKVFRFIISESSNLIIAIPKFLINAFITLFLFFYFLKDGEKIVKDIKGLIPLTEAHKNTVVSEFKNVTHAIVYGLILTGIIIGITSTIGFLIFKVSSPILWGLLVLIVSILPGIGNTLIWGPIGVIKIINNDSFNGIGLLVYGALFISGLETIIKPKLIGYKSKIHPVFVVLGVFGGISLLGFIGAFFGPLILIVFITLLKSILIKK
ncbi:MAG: AI-2E family transporter [Nanoarchaeota archaeon]